MTNFQISPILLFILCGWFGRCPPPSPTIPLPPVTVALAEGETAVSVPAPTPENEQLQSLNPWAFPWANAGMADSGYCPMVHGWGWIGSLLWPVAGFTELRPFGWLGPGRGFHSGIDIYAPSGTAVIAPTSGAIVWRGYSSAGYGVAVGIASSGYTVILAHLSAVTEGLECGDSVTAGSVVGYVGRTGAVAGATHLHLGIEHEGLAWNPGLWLPG